MTCKGIIVKGVTNKAMDGAYEDLKAAMEKGDMVQVKRSWQALNKAYNTWTYTKLMGRPPERP